MSQHPNFGDFIKENKTLVKEYVETQISIVRLEAIRTASKTSGYFMWIVISLFLFFLIAIFAGLVLGFWLSDVTGSFIKGFGITTIIMILIVIILALLRKTLFVNPAVKAIISHFHDNDDEHKTPPASL